MNIADIINQRKKEKNQVITSIPVEDLNKPLIMALFGIDVYGKDATDDEILSIIIGKESTIYRSYMNDFEKAWDDAVATGKVTKKGNKYWMDGKMILKPVTRSL